VCVCGQNFSVFYRSNQAAWYLIVITKIGLLKAKKAGIPNHSNE
jgi:hypothetical protein